MDQQQSAQPLQVTPAPAKQRDFTKWIIIALLSIAVIGTGIAYLVFSSFGTKQLAPSPSPSENTVSENTGTLKALQEWKKYTNAEHNYSFVYFGTWTIEEAPGENLDFVLSHVSKAKPATVEGRFLSAAGRTKSYCEQNRNDEERCNISKITANREIIVDFANTVETGKISILVAHPAQGALSIDIIESNFDSSILMTLISSTLQFDDEERLVKLQFCPTSWSEDRGTAFFQGLSFDPKDFDKQCQ